MLNDPILHSFLDEIRAGEKTGRSAAQLEPFFDKLQSGAGDLDIELFDAFREIARRPSPLRERLQACCDLLQEAFGPKPTLVVRRRGCLRPSGGYSPSRASEET